MKKIGLLSLLFLSIFAIASCSNETNTTNNDIKNYLNAVKSNNFNENGFKLYFSEKYNITSHNDNEKEKIDFIYNYEGEASFKISKDFLAFDSDNIFGDLIENDGYIDGLQYKKEYIDYEELDKSSNETKTEISNLETSYNFKMLLHNDSCSVLSKLETNDLINDTLSNKKFNGKINESKFEENSISTLNNYLSQVIIMEGYNIAYFVESYAFNNLIDSAAFDDDSFNKYIEDNNVIMYETLDKTFIEFEIDFKNQLKEVYEIDDDKRINVKGKIAFDSATKSLLYYTYDVKDYFLAILEHDNDKTISIEEFIFTGEALGFDLSAIAFDEELKEYSDMDEFMSDFIGNAISEDN